jgi:hypothetical protein
MLVAAILFVVIHFRPVASLGEMIGYIAIPLACFYLLFAVIGISRAERDTLLRLVRLRGAK